MSHQPTPPHSHQGGRGHGPRLSTASAALARTPSYQSTPSAAGKSTTTLPSFDKGGGISLEQSVRKFRVVEALRSGDTAFISKTIRETSDVAATGGGWAAS